MKSVIVFILSLLCILMSRFLYALGFPRLHYLRQGNPTFELVGHQKIWLSSGPFYSSGKRKSNWNQHSLDFYVSFIDRTFSSMQERPSLENLSLLQVLHGKGGFQNILRRRRGNSMRKRGKLPEQITCRCGHVSFLFYRGWETMSCQSSR